MNQYYKWSLVPTAVLALFLALLANTASAAFLQYFDINGTTAGSGVVNGGSYSWEGTSWASNSAGTTISFPWAEGNLAEFSAGSDATGSYTVTASANHTISGIHITTGTANTVTIDGPGQLALAAGSNTFSMVNGSQSLVVNASLTGSGSLGLTGSSGQTANFYLYGNNSYSGFTFLGTMATVYFNNNNSFGTGTIAWSGASPVLSPQGSSPITLPNAMNTMSGVTLTFAGSATAPTTINGAVNMFGGTSTLTVGNAGNPNTKLTLAGTISGGNLIVNGTTGNLTLSGANNFGGTLTAGGTTKIILANNNALHGVTSLIMSGGTLAVNGTANSLGTLGLTAISTIDFGNIAGSLTLANSSGNSWSGMLDIVNFDVNTDTVFVGTDATGLTTAQLADIEIDGNAVSINSAGELIVVPEPSSMELGVLGGLGMLWMLMRRHRRTFCAQPSLEKISRRAPANRIRSST